MEIYETGELSRDEVFKFKVFLEEEIGTYYETTNCFDNNKKVISIFELTRKEVEKIRKFEIRLTKIN